MLRFTPSYGLGGLLTFASSALSICWRATAPVMPTSQMTLDDFVSKLLFALDMMNDRAEAHTQILARMVMQMGEIDLTLQAIVSGLD